MTSVRETAGTCPQNEPGRHLTISPSPAGDEETGESPMMP